MSTYSGREYQFKIEQRGPRLIARLQRIANNRDLKEILTLFGALSLRNDSQNQSSSAAEHVEYNQDTSVVNCENPDVGSVWLMIEYAPWRRKINKKEINKI